MPNHVGISQAPLKDLEAWAMATEKEIDEIHAQLAPLEEQMQAAQERLGLIRRLIGLSRQETRSGNDTPAQDTLLPLGAELEDHLESLLSDAGEPLHISVLKDRLIERGVPLPGKGDEANIIVRMRRDQERFTRTGRGMYGLTRWGLPAAAPTRRKKVRRRRAASA